MGGVLAERHKHKGYICPFAAYDSAIPSLHSTSADSVSMLIHHSVVSIWECSQTGSQPCSHESVSAYQAIEDFMSMGVVNVKNISRRAHHPSLAFVACLSK